MPEETSQRDEVERGQGEAAIRVQAMLWSEHAVRLGSRTASEIVASVLDVDPRQREHTYEVDDGVTSVVFTRAQLLSVVAPGTTL